jgi:hypothetical protein
VTDVLGGVVAAIPADAVNGQPGGSVIAGVVVIANVTGGPHVHHLMTLCIYFR